MSTGTDNIMHQSRTSALKIYEAAGLKQGNKVLDILKVGEVFRVYHVQAESSTIHPDDSGIIRTNSLYKIHEIKGQKPFDETTHAIADRVTPEGVVIGEHLYCIPLVRIIRVTNPDSHKILYLNRPKVHDVLTEAASVSHD
jgi:hypothetical protein